MPSHLIDYQLFGDQFSTPEIRAVFDERLLRGAASTAPETAVAAHERDMSVGRAEWVLVRGRLPGGGGAPLVGRRRAWPACQRGADA